MEVIKYTPVGVCSRSIQFSIKDGKLTGVKFQNGCEGNLKGISRLVEGMDIGEVIVRLKGINCGGKGTSCPDQLVRALEAEITKQKAV